MQHDLFVNPNTRARRIYPLLVVLQADVAEGDERIVAPLSPSSVVAGPPMRLRPVVRHDGTDYTVIMRLLAMLPLRQLRHPVGSIGHYRDDLTRALGWLFWGI
jgi:hypothetical protein